MAQPQFLQLLDVTCISTEDMIREDSLYGVLGSSRFEVGQFNVGVSVTQFREQIVPEGVLALQIYEKDLMDPDDLIGTINLSRNMDVENAVTLRKGTAEYLIRYFVISG